MKKISASSNPRRSGRDTVPKIHFTIENKPPKKRKKTHHHHFAQSTTSGPAKKESIVQKQEELAQSVSPNENTASDIGAESGSDLKSNAAHRLQPTAENQSKLFAANQPKPIDDQPMPIGIYKVRKTVNCGKNPDSFTPPGKSKMNLTHSHPELQNGMLGSCVNELQKRGVNLTVKELLARNFKNIKLRPSVTSDTAEKIVHQSLSENIVPEGFKLSGTPLIPSNTDMRNLYQPKNPKTDNLPNTSSDAIAEFARETKLKPTSEILKTLKNALGSTVDKEETSIDNATFERLDNESEEVIVKIANEILSNPQQTAKKIPVAYRGNQLPWQVMWKNVPNYTQGDMFVYVDNFAYSPITDIMKSGIFGITMDHPVSFIYKGKHLRLTFMELLQANGINLIPDIGEYKMVQGLLHKSGVHIRSDYANRLHEMTSILNKEIPEKVFEPIKLTPERLPMICANPGIFIEYLGQNIPGANIVDTSVNQESFLDQSYLKTTYCEYLPFHARRWILILNDTGKTTQQISAKIGCFNQTVQETVATRILIERHLISEYINESQASQLEASLSSKKLTKDGRRMRPSKNFRSPDIYDLNNLVWNHFVDCQTCGVHIEEEYLKDQAIIYAKHIGLETFHNSEKWLDVFIRHHKIDFASMTGVSVLHGEDMFDEVYKEFQDLSKSNAYQQLPDDFWIKLKGFLNDTLPPPKSGPSLVALILNMISSCTFSAQSEQLGDALNILRSHILVHDPSALSLFLPLQERLSQQKTSANRTGGPSSSSN